MRQWAGSFQVVPTRPVNPALYPSDISLTVHDMNKDRFHNQLALHLGYERIVKDKRITIEVDEAHDPWVTLKIQGHTDVVRFKASDDVNKVELNSIPAMQEEISVVRDAVHQAYCDACSSRF